MEACTEREEDSEETIEAVPNWGDKEGKGLSEAPLMDIKGEFEGSKGVVEGNPVSVP